MSNSSRINRRPRILLGITGSIAAVKGPKLALRLADEVKADVKVVLTRTVEHYFWKEGRAVSTYDGESWRKFQAAASKSPVTDGEADGEHVDWRLTKGSISIHYAEEEWNDYKSLSDSVLHIDLRNWADIFLIAPLSAHTLAKISNGLCDDLMTCCLRAWDFGQRKHLSSPGKPVILAPAMNTAMWDHPLTKMQLETIQQFTGGEKLEGEGKQGSKRETGVIIVEPAVKTLACGEVGAGALAELDDIICAVMKCLHQWKIDGNFAGMNNGASSTDSSFEKKESMKRALLKFAKERFSEIKASHEQQSTGPNSSSSQLVAPISPTPELIIEALLPRLSLDSNSFLVDLGCGDGRWLIAANEHTQCRCLGIDVDKERLRLAQESITKNGLQELVKVREQDVFQFVKGCDDIFKADVIVIYLFREAMMEIGPLLHQRLVLNYRNNRIPSKIVHILSVGFALTGWTPAYEEKFNGIRVYLYNLDG